MDPSLANIDKDEKLQRMYACLDIHQSLLKIGKTMQMIDVYDKLDFTNNYEGTGDIFVDYHGMVQNVHGSSQKQ